MDGFATHLIQNQAFEPAAFVKPFTRSSRARDVKPKLSAVMGAGVKFAAGIACMGVRKMRGYCPSGGTIKLCRVLLAMILLASVLRPPFAYAGSDDKPNLAFVDAAAVVLSPDSSGAFKTDLAIKNSGKAGTAATKLLRADKQECAGGTLTPGTITLESNAIEVKRFEITNVRLPANCFIELVVEPDGNTSLKQIKLAQQYASLPVLVALAICFVISLVVAYAAKNSVGELPETFTLGSPAWEFAKSWASTATLVGAAISTALTLSALPELTQYASKSGYALLALAISFVVIVAPFVFIVFRTGKPKKDSDKPTFSVEYEGPLQAFIISSAFTLFAGLAQLIVLLLLVHEVFHEPWSLAAGVVLGLVLGRGLCVYAFQSIVLTIELQKKYKDGPPTDQQRADFLAENEAVPAVVKGPRATWPIL